MSHRLSKIGDGAVGCDLPMPESDNIAPQAGGRIERQRLRVRQKKWWGIRTMVECLPQAVGRLAEVAAARCSENSGQSNPASASRR